MILNFDVSFFREAALKFASYNGRVEVVTQFLNHPNIDVNKVIYKIKNVNMKIIVSRLNTR